MELMVCFNALLYYYYRTNLDVVTLKTEQIEIKASNLNKLLLSGVVKLFVTNIKCYKCYLRRCVKVDTVHMLICRPVFRNWYTQDCVRKFAQKLCESGHRPKKGNLTRFFSTEWHHFRISHGFSNFRSYFKKPACRHHLTPNKMHFGQNNVNYLSQVKR